MNTEIQRKSDSQQIHLDIMQKLTCVGFIHLELR